MLKYSIEKKTFKFKTPSGTSRGVLTEKYAWFISIWEENNPKIIGIGECSVIPGLSPDYQNHVQYEAEIYEFCNKLISELMFPYLNQEAFSKTSFYTNLKKYPSIFFGIECALLDLLQGGKALFFETEYTQKKQSIPINGLIWMGGESFMQKQIEEKITSGFQCLKMKIGALDFQKELQILKQIRIKYSIDELIIRVDANGAFDFKDALNKLNRLAEIDIHSIEQPIKAGNWEDMAYLCENSKLPIALDEELIDVILKDEKIKLLNTIKPQYIILKPSLHGGFIGCKEWIELANTLNISWWITSALESNIGLNAIAQFTSSFENKTFHGLGTGTLYTNNTPTKSNIKKGHLYYTNTL